MKIFVSWFEEKGREVALVLSELLGNVLPFVEVGISAQDIHNGSQWLSELPRLMENTEFAIVIVTSKQVDSPWVPLEAGYLLRAIDASNIQVVMVDFSLTDLSAPMGQLKAISVNREDILKLTHLINKRSLECGNQGVAEIELQTFFEIHWPKCESQLLKFGQQAPERMRSDREVLYEILELSRGIARTVGSPKSVNSGDAVKTLAKARGVGGTKRSSADKRTLAELTQLVEELITKKEED